MADSLDKSLEQLSAERKAQRKSSGRGGRDSSRGGRDGGNHRGGRRSGGPMRPQGGQNRSAPFREGGRKNLDAKWTHDKFDDPNVDRQARRERADASSAPRASSGGFQQHKIKITNLNYSVDEKDLKELFGTIGEVKHVQIKYDASGRSDGEAYVTFDSAGEADKAKAQFDGKAIDGVQMGIEVIHSAGRPPRRDRDNSDNDRPRRGGRGGGDRSGGDRHNGGGRSGGGRGGNSAEDPSNIKIRVTL